MVDAYASVEVMGLSVAGSALRWLISQSPSEGFIASCENARFVSRDIEQTVKSDENKSQTRRWKERDTRPPRFERAEEVKNHRIIADQREDNASLDFP
jgi:hypothetical protein